MGADKSDCGGGTGDEQLYMPSKGETGGRQDAAARGLEEFGTPLGKEEICNDDLYRVEYGVYQ